MAPKRAKDADTKTMGIEKEDIPDHLTKPTKTRAAILKNLKMPPHWRQFLKVTKKRSDGGGGGDDDDAGDEEDKESDDVYLLLRFPKNPTAKKAKTSK